MNRPEQQIQRAIVDGLRLALPHGWEIVAVANKPRSKVSGAIEKAMGARKGFPDLMILGRGHKDLRDQHFEAPTAWFLEVKSKVGRLSPEQRECHNRLMDLGFPVAVIRSLDEALAAARRWDLPIRMTTGRAA